MENLLVGLLIVCVVALAFLIIQNYMLRMRQQALLEALQALRGGYYSPAVAGKGTPEQTGNNSVWFWVALLLSALVFLTWLLLRPL